MCQCHEIFDRIELGERGRGYFISAAAGDNGGRLPTDACVRLVSKRASCRRSQWVSEARGGVITDTMCSTFPPAIAKVFISCQKNGCKILTLFYG